PTNVLKVARATKRFDSKDVSQVTYYNAGVGAMNRAPDAGARIVRWVDNTVGGGWGSGFEVNIEEAYTFLADNYTEGDEIFIFGFSRGAAQARSLCGLIEWFGGFPTKNDVYYVPRIVTRYLRAQGKPESPTLWEELNQRRQARGSQPLDAIQKANIVFLGVWDTVLALGSRLLAGGGTTRKEKKFHTRAAPPKKVMHVRHALAIDESRHDFQPEVFDGGTSHPSLQQRWFAGVHSDVGGGLQWDGLANCALRWMTQEAAAAGLEFREDFLDFYEEAPQAVASKKSIGFKVADTLLRPVRGFKGVRDLTQAAGMLPDQTVFDRLNFEPKSDSSESGDLPKMSEPYRPANLLQFLAEHPELDGRLGPDALAAVRKLR
ncbi:MAG: DUF2235 domain-containing protein, partial [Sedimenticolaceae bacterium]